MIQKIRLFFTHAPFFALLFPLTITFTNFSTNQNRLPLNELVTVSVAFIFLALCLCFLFYFFIRSQRRSALIATTIIFYFFYFPTIARAIGGSNFELAILAAGLVISVYLCCELSRTPNDEHLSFILNCLFIVLVLPPLISIVTYQMQQSPNRPVAQDIFPDIPYTSIPNGPDVWHLVFDRYASQETLARVYSFDNHPFLDSLRQRGFSVADNAFANYQRTAHSMASTLNIDYLKKLSPGIDRENTDWLPVYTVLQNHRIGRLFTQWHYNFYHLGSWWNPTRTNPVATENRNFRDMPESFRSIMSQSLFGRLGLNDIISWPYTNNRHDQCQRIYFQFNELTQLANSNEKKYILAHILLPHPPFVMDATGKCKTLQEAATSSRQHNYLDQLIFANTQILALVDAIQKGARPAVIILQSDEGPWPEKYVGNEALIGQDVTPVKWKDVSRQDLREKTQILYAIYGAGFPADQLVKHLSPVNTYRMILNQYFGFNLPMLPDKSYIFIDNRRLYTFQDITNEVE